MIIAHPLGTLNRGLSLTHSTYHTFDPPTVVVIAAIGYDLVRELDVVFKPLEISHIDHIITVLPNKAIDFWVSPRCDDGYLAPPIMGSTGATGGNKRAVPWELSFLTQNTIDVQWFLGLSGFRCSGWWEPLTQHS